MALGLFKKPYVIRQHYVQRVIYGHAEATYTDKITRLNVQPQAPDSYQGDPEGEKTVKHLKSWGNCELNSANDHTDTPGDLLFYNGLWYECTSSVMWDHTILQHYQSDFVLLPANNQPPPPEIRP